MRIRSGTIALVYRILFLLVCALGLLLAAGVFDGRLSLYGYRYYTLLSNLLCFVFFLAYVLAGPALRARLARWKGAVTMAILVTMLIYQFMLAETPFSMGTGDGMLQNLITHLIVPVMVLLDWLLFDVKGRYRLLDPVLWLAVPLCYLLLAMLGAELGMTYYGGARYPYFFMDVDALGWLGVLRMIGLLAAGFLVLGYVFYFIDRGLARLAKEGAA